MQISDFVRQFLSRFRSKCYNELTVRQFIVTQLLRYVSCELTGGGVQPLILVSTLIISFSTPGCGYTPLHTSPLLASGDAEPCNFLTTSTLLQTNNADLLDNL